MPIVAEADFIEYVGSEIYANQPHLSASLLAAESAVNHHCRRRFVIAGTPRAVADGVTVIGQTAVTSATAAFVESDVGQTIVGVGIPDDTTIVARTDATTVELSAAATVSGTGVTLTLSATPRLFIPTHSFVTVDDFVVTTTTDLVVVDNGTTIASTDYQLEPLNGRDEAGNAVPYTHIWRLAGGWYRTWNHLAATVSVTPTGWGWLAIPVDVVEACRVLAKDFAALRDTRFGVAGFGEFGVVRMRENPQVMSLLQPYVRHRIGVAPDAR